MPIGGEVNKLHDYDCRELVVVPINMESECCVSIEPFMTTPVSDSYRYVFAPSVLPTAVLVPDNAIATNVSNGEKFIAMSTIPIESFLTKLSRYKNDVLSSECNPLPSIVAEPFPSANASLAESIRSKTCLAFPICGLPGASSAVL